MDDAFSLGGVVYGTDVVSSGPPMEGPLWMMCFLLDRCGAGQYFTNGKYRYKHSGKGRYHGNEEGPSTQAGRCHHEIWLSRETGNGIGKELEKEILHVEW